MRHLLVGALLIAIAAVAAWSIDGHAGPRGGEATDVKSIQQEGVVVAQARRMTRQRTPKLSPELRSALERGTARQAVNVARSLGIMTGGPGVDEYTCSQTSCWCAGAADCVKLKLDDKCAEGTIDCSDSGCQCTPK
jgi:hypothetical protein